MAVGLVQQLKRRARPLVCPFEPLLAGIPDGSAVFDIGCGSGYLLGLIAQSKSPRSLSGVEIDPSLVAATQSHLQTIAPQTRAMISAYDGASFPAELGAADVVLLVDVLHHVSAAKQEQFLTRVAAGMQQGARLILKDIDAGRPLLCFCNKLHDLISSGEIGDERRAGEVEEILRASGLKIIGHGAERRLWYPHYWFICEKP